MNPVEEALADLHDSGVDAPEGLARIYRFLSDLLVDDDLAEEFRPYLVGCVGALCMVHPILDSEVRNRLALKYLCASVVRQVATQPDGAELVRRHWRGERSVQDVFSDIIRRGNDEFSRQEIQRVYRFAGFEPKG